MVRGDRVLREMKKYEPCELAPVRHMSSAGGRSYGETLETHGIAHVYNHWSDMPSLAEQHQRLERFTAPFTVLRLLTPLKMTYDAAKARAEPYNKIVGELPEVRRDTIELVKKAMADKRQAYVVVNNKSEGNAPSTIQALMKALQGNENEKTTFPS